MSRQLHPFSRKAQSAFLVACSLTAVLASCDRSPTRPGMSSNERSLRVGRGEAASTIKRGRGFEDRILDIEANVPGFGGLSIDTDGSLKAFVTDVAASPAAIVAIQRLMADHPDLFARADGSLPAIRILRGAFPFSSLVRWAELITAQATPASGIRLVDADEALNRVRIGIGTASAEAGVRVTAQKLGLPDDALAFVVMDGEFHAATSVQDRVATTHGGIQIGWLKVAGDTVICTLGFNVKVSSVKYILTAGHCTENYTGSTGEVWNQEKPGRRVGVESNNPAWRTSGCASGATYCDTADVALILYDDTVTTEFKLVETSTVGTGDNDGNLTVGSTYSVGGVGSDRASGDTVYKTGRTTGSTKGPITGTCVNLPAYASPTRSLACQYEVQAKSGPGDSGAPIYRWGVPLVTTSRFALGTLHTTYNPQFQGDHYKYYFSTWNEAQARLGVTMSPF